jgi:ABC-type enterochelin transport system ATPase subunit
MATTKFVSLIGARVGVVEVGPYDTAGVRFRTTKILSSVSYRTEIGEIFYVGPHMGADVFDTKDAAFAHTLEYIEQAIEEAMKLNFDNLVTWGRGSFEHKLKGIEEMRRQKLKVMEDSRG